MGPPWCIFINDLAFLKIIIHFPLRRSSEGSYMNRGPALVTSLPLLSFITIRFGSLWRAVLNRWFEIESIAMRRSLFLSGAPSAQLSRNARGAICFLFLKHPQLPSPAPNLISTDSKDPRPQKCGYSSSNRQYRFAHHKAEFLTSRGPSPIAFSQIDQAGRSTRHGTLTTVA